MHEGYPVYQIILPIRESAEDRMQQLWRLKESYRLGLWVDEFGQKWPQKFAELSGAPVASNTIEEVKEAVKEVAKRIRLGGLSHG